jgi:hypothetical protein
MQSNSTDNISMDSRCLSNVSIHCCDEAYWMDSTDEAAIKREKKEITTQEHRIICHVKDDDDATIFLAWTTKSSRMA